MNYDRDTRQSDFKPVSPWHFISNLQPSYQLSPHFWVSGWWCIYWLSMSSLKALFSPLLKWGSACAIFFLSWKNNSSENLFRKEHLPNLPWRKGDLRRKLPLGSVVIGSISNFQSYRRSKCPSMILGLYMHKLWFLPPKTHGGWTIWSKYSCYNFIPNPNAGKRKHISWENKPF